MSVGDPYQESAEVSEMPGGDEAEAGRSTFLRGVSAAAIYLPLSKGGDRGAWQKLVNDFFFLEST